MPREQQSRLWGFLRGIRPEEWRTEMNAQVKRGEREAEIRKEINAPSRYFPTRSHMIRNGSYVGVQEYTEEEYKEDNRKRRARGQDQPSRSGWPEPWELDF